jgi:hypothetical protein
MPDYRTIKLATDLAAALALAGCGSTGSKTADPAKTAGLVKDAASALVVAFNAHDAKKAVSFDAGEYIGMMHGTNNVIGPGQDLGLTTKQLEDPAAKLAMSDLAVDVANSGEMAVSTATYAYTFTDPVTKAPTTEKGNWVIGWKLQPDGNVKATWSVVSDTAKPAA